MPLKAPGFESITLTLPSRLELLSVLDRVAVALCERCQFDSDTCSQVSLSVIEAGTNAVQHGHKKDASKPFDVTFTVFKDRMEIVVHDSGTGFALDQQNDDATAPEHLYDARGRGIFIMRACMDSVDFRFGATGTECHLVKRRPVAAQ